MRTARLQGALAAPALHALPTSRPVAASRIAARRAPAPAPAARRPDLRASAVAEASGADAGAAPASDIPQPVVKIDNQADPFATVVTVEFGDRLGELLDTVAALKDLGLNIRRAKLGAGGGGGHRFYITDARKSEKVVKSAKLEEIRLTILNNLLRFHPESAEGLAWAPRAAAPPRGAKPRRPLGATPRTPGATAVEARSEGPDAPYTQLHIVTMDRPGLLTDIVRTLKDISLNVVSAEVDTIGVKAVDQFNVTYKGEQLPPQMCTLAVNALTYYLSASEIEKEFEESY